jgi:ketosteroid isomerase-like protein
MSNAETLTAALSGLFSGNEIEMTGTMVERMLDALAPISDESIEMVMRGSDQFVVTFEGTDGVRAGWADWLESFDRLRFRLERTESIGDNVLMIGDQIGVTRHGGVEMEQPSAIVWRFRDGLIGAVEFHLDRELALSSARERG